MDKKNFLTWENAGKVAVGLWLANKILYVPPIKHKTICNPSKPIINPQ